MTDGSLPGTNDLAHAVVADPKVGRIVAALAGSLGIDCAAVAHVRELIPGPGALAADVKRRSYGPLDALGAARRLVHQSARRGRDAVALVTALDRPLGRAFGESLELEEVVHTLTGDGPPDLVRVASALAAELVAMAGVAPTRDAGYRSIEVALSSGRAAAAFREMLERAGENPGIVDDPAVLPQATSCELFAAPRRGFVARVDPALLSAAAPLLDGVAGGFVVTARPGDWVERGEPLATVFAADDAAIDVGRTALARAIVVADEADPPLPVISHRVTAAGAEPYPW